MEGEDWSLEQREPGRVILLITVCLGKGCFFIAWRICVRFIVRTVLFTAIVTSSKPITSSKGGRCWDQAVEISLLLSVYFPTLKSSEGYFPRFECVWLLKINVFSNQSMLLELFLGRIYRPVQEDLRSYTGQNTRRTEENKQLESVWSLGLRFESRCRVQFSDLFLLFYQHNLR